MRLLEGEELNGLYPGLTNINNSCYFNATMQALFACDALCDVIIANENLGPLGNSLKALFEQMRTSYSTIEMQKYMESIVDAIPCSASDNSIVKAMKEKINTDQSSQQDAGELLTLLTNVLSEAEETALLKQSLTSPSSEKN